MLPQNSTIKSNVLVCINYATYEFAWWVAHTHASATATKAKASSPIINTLQNICTYKALYIITFIICCCYYLFKNI